MNQEHTDYLFTTYSQLFPQDRSSPRWNLMCFGFEARDGWFDLLDEALSRISELSEPCCIKQVKEKWGGLRIYVDASEEVQEILQEVEERSYHICEVCGKSGTLRQDLGWHQTLCDEHAREVGSRWEA